MKKLNFKSVLYSLSIVLSIVMFSCVNDDFDTPPSTTIPVGDTLTIQEIKTLYNNVEYLFTTDASVFAVVTMDDKNGNIYKTAYIQDHTGALALHLDAAGGLYQGDSIRVQLNGLKIGKYRELFQIDATDGNGFTLDNYITKLDTKVVIEPEVVTFDQVFADSAYFQGRLVKFENVQFSLADTSKTYADAVTGTSENRVLENFSKNIMVVRSSGYAEIADISVADGSGSVVAIVGQYDTDLQLYLRSKEEILMTGERHWMNYSLSAPVAELEESFNLGTSDLPVTYSGWINHNEEGRSYWTKTYYSGNSYAEVGAYKSGLDQVKSWLILPQIAVGTDYALSFQNAMAYWEHGNDKPLKVVISTNFTGIVEQATWTDLSAKFADYNNTNYQWVSSGNVDLRPYDGQSVTIAFVYTGSDSKSTTAIVDDIRVGVVEGGFGQEVFGEEFTSSIGKFTQYSVTGTPVWAYSSSYKCATINGYGSNNEDWLISNVINLSSYTDITLSFRYAVGFGSYGTVFDDIKVFVSSDYSGTGDPNTATWEEKTFTEADLDPYWQWTNSGNIDLSTYAGESTVYVAFKYTSTSSLACAWEVDNVSIVAE